MLGAAPPSVHILTNPLSQEDKAAKAAKAADSGNNKAASKEAEGDRKF